MAGIFCDFENREFPETEFVATDDGVQIHVISADRGHDRNGFTATFELDDTAGSNRRFTWILVQRGTIPQTQFDAAEETEPG